MSLTPSSTWVEGDLITAEKLNRIEEKVSLLEKTPFFISWIEEEAEGDDSFVRRTDLTFGEIYEAFSMGYPVMFITSTTYNNNEAVEYCYIVSDCSIDFYEELGYYGEIKGNFSRMSVRTIPCQSIEELNNTYLYQERIK